MNYMDPAAGQLAVVDFLDGEYRIVKPGEYVLCAVTGARIALSELRYWNVDEQEAYVSPEVALQRFQQLRETKSGA